MYLNNVKQACNEPKSPYISSDEPKAELNETNWARRISNEHKSG